MEREQLEVSLSCLNSRGEAEAGLLSQKPGGAAPRSVICSRRVLFSRFFLGLQAGMLHLLSLTD